MSFFLNDLTNRALSIKPDNVNHFIQDYFQQVKSCLHVIGTDFRYVIESNHNRRSFVYCLIEAFLGFSENDELTAYDYYCIVELISPNFPKSIITDAIVALSSHNHVPMISNSSNESEILNSTITYPFKELSIAVYFQLIYDEWIKLVEEFFSSENENPMVSNNVTNAVISSSKIKSKITEFNHLFSLSFFQPPLEVVNMAVDFLVKSNNNDDLISYDSFRKGILLNKAIATEIYRITQNPSVMGSF
eukprot:gene14461-19409_t